MYYTFCTENQVQKVEVTTCNWIVELRSDGTGVTTINIITETSFVDLNFKS